MLSKNRTDMNTKKLILYIVILFCVYTLINNIFYISSQPEESVKFPVKYSSENINYSHYCINDFELLNEKHEVLNFSNVLNRDYTVLFVFSEKDCKNCIDDYLGIMKQHFRKNEVIVLSDHPNYRALKYYKQNFNVPFEFFRKNNQTDSIDFDSIRTPFMSIVANKNMLEYLCIPDYSRKEDFKSVLLLYKRIMK